MLRYDDIPAHEIRIDASKSIGPLETWRHCMGQGGINSLPLPTAVIEAAAALRLPLIRIFLQQYLDPLRADGSYDWSLMDAYVDSFAKTGAHIMAALCLKPPALFPKLDQHVLLPDDPADWAALAQAVAQRYDGVITHWEVGNETDIGEMGGCPYLIEDDDDYNAYYKLTATALLRGSANAKVGGSAIANSFDGTQLESLIAYCRAGNAPLDFVSWHGYNDDPEAHIACLRRYKALIADWPGVRPLTCVTEWAASFPSEGGAVVERADEPRRAAGYFAAIRRYLDEGLDYSFFYHLCDNTFYHDEFRPFYSDLNIMDKHWNQVPHRFGVFGHDGRARPHYQIWRMLRGLGEEQLAAASAYPDLWALAGTGQGGPQAMIANFNVDGTGPLIADVWFDHLEPGVYEISLERVHGRDGLSRDGMELEVIDSRDISTAGSWRCPVYLPPYAVARLAMKRVR